MTSQTPDRVYFKGGKFALCGFSGPDLIDIRSHGLNPKAVSTANYRGWTAEYSVADKLILSNLYVSHDAGHPVLNRQPKGPKIHGIEPSLPKAFTGYNCAYLGLDMPLDYSGGILIGDRHVISGPGCMFWQFAEVYELIFEGGRVLSCSEKSQVAALVRDKYLGKVLVRYNVVIDDAEARDEIGGSFLGKYRF